MTAEHFFIGCHVRSVDGCYVGTVEDRDSYGWPVVAARSAHETPHTETRRLYEAPGYWRVIT